MPLVSLRQNFDEWTITVYGKTFEGENFRGFRGFLANRKSFPLESFPLYSTQWHGPDAPRKFSSEWCVLCKTAKVFPLESFAVYGTHQIHQYFVITILCYNMVLISRGQTLFAQALIDWRL